MKTEEQIREMLKDISNEMKSIEDTMEYQLEEPESVEQYNYFKTQKDILKDILEEK